MQFRYNALGRQSETVDANGRSKKVFYDRAGRVAWMENEMAQPVEYAYNAAGNRLTLSDANGNTTLFDYDRDGTLYDPAGNILALYHGAVVADTDSIPADRLIAKYERNGTGAVTKEEDSLTAMLYSYDAFGRLVESRDRTLEKSVRYAYDARSLRSKMEVVDYASSQTGVVSMAVAYGYDDAGRLASVKKDADPAAVYEYDLAGRRTKLTLPNGVATEYTYDNGDRLLDLTTRKDQNVLAKFAYTFDSTGNRTGITYADGTRSLYEFDNAYRLTRDLRVDSSNQTLYDESFTYDAVGNRLSKTRTGWNSVDTQYVYNGRNQLVSTSGTEPKTYTYDANGNPICINTGISNETMQYDVLNRLTRYQGPNGNEETNYRGAAWRRLKVADEGVATSFLYDGDNVVADYDAILNLSTLYVTAGLDQNMSISFITGDIPGTYFYTQDALGSVRTLTHVTGAVQNRYDYTAFGESYNQSINVQQRYAFTGREQRPATGDLFYYRHRSYNPTVGRFDKRDPVGYRRNKNGSLYIYVNSRPQLLIDPLGLWGSKTHEKLTKDAMMLAGCNNACVPIMAAANVGVDGGAGDALEWFFDIGNSQEMLSPHYMSYDSYDTTVAKDEADALINRLLGMAYAYAREGDCENGAKYFGQALHTIQDSFSHSDDKGNPMTDRYHRNAIILDWTPLVGWGVTGVDSESENSNKYIGARNASAQAAAKYVDILTNEGCFECK